MKRDRPLIAVTMGDPSGVGPEICVKALCFAPLRQKVTPFIIGDAALLRSALCLMKPEQAQDKIRIISSPEKVDVNPGVISVLDLNNVEDAVHQYGKVSAESGRAAADYIRTAIDLALKAEVDGVATAPIQKESFKAAGIPYPGHTEMFADLTGTRDVALMLMLDTFRVIHVTLHVALKDAVQAITRERVLRVIRVAERGCRQMGIQKPRIGVAGLNPHAGEEGLFGSEEKDVIKPAIQEACREGIRAQGPFSADTVFSRLKGGGFDIVVCMTHDQGGIPMKLLSFDWDEGSKTWSRIRGVNVTLGLPIVRTSVSHGTGFEIAGQGLADATSLQEAIETAAQMAASRRQVTL